LRLALTNGVKNAIEATEALVPLDIREPVAVNWGTTDIEQWVAVIDQGAGLDIAKEQAFRMGESAKDGHSGIGLSIAQQAMESLEGSCSLSPGTPKGAEFNMRWYLS
jgi:sensor histidine kinase regulating citrate/malate metabolism